MVVMLTFSTIMKGSKRTMYKFILLSIVGGFVFSGSWNIVAKSDETANPVKNQYCWAEDTSSDDKLEAGRRRGKGNKGRRRGGSGLR